MSENRKHANNDNGFATVSERREEILEKLKEIPRKARREHILKECQDEYAAIDLGRELTDDEQLAEAEAIDEARDLNVRAAKFKALRQYFQKGIQRKSNDPNSELFKTAREALGLLDQIEVDISSATDHQMLKYESLFDLYTELLRAELEKPAETEQTNAKSTFLAVLFSFLGILAFVLWVHRIPITWLKDHPHGPGLQGSIIFLIPCLVVGYFKPKYRKWCWGAAALSLVVLILNLL
ncbi:MAG TPA: hypothetical protein HPP87_10985 [Planctomycetes bacterium]|nr:hypothetical protein [Planctomycetota bacterium]